VTEHYLQIKVAYPKLKLVEYLLGLRHGPLIDTASSKTATAESKTMSTAGGWTIQFSKGFQVVGEGFVGTCKRKTVDYWTDMTDEMDDAQDDRAEISL
jgi:hypothetical protein